MTFRIPRSPYLLIPLVCSCLPWIVLLPMLHAAKSSYDDEGAFIFGGLAGIASFLITGPLAAAQLRLSNRDRSIGILNYTLLYYLICAPTIGFQAGTSSSLLLAFVLTSTHVESLPIGVISATLLGVCIYAVTAILMNLFVTVVQRTVT